MPIQINENLRGFLDSNYVFPTMNPDMAGNKLVGDFLYPDRVTSVEDYYKDVISFVLGDLGDKHGVSFGSYTPHPKDTSLGRYSPRDNAIVMSTKVLAQPPHAHGTQIAAHEAFHKHQREVNAQSKMFGRLQGSYTVGSSQTLAITLGYENPLRFYRISEVERQAYYYNTLFTNSFLSRAKELARFMRDEERIQYVENETKLMNATNASIEHGIRASEDSFIASSLSNFYDRSNKQFQNLMHYYLDAERGASDELLRRTYPKTAQLFDKAEGLEFTPEGATKAMAMVLSGCPKKENVRMYIDMITCSGRDVTAAAVKAIAENRVPITRSDYTRLALTAGNRADNVPGMFSAEVVDLIDEETWTRNLVTTLGAAQARNVIAGLKNSGEMPNTDFGIVDRVVAAYSDKPIAVIDGQSFYGCRDLLQYVSSRDTQRYAHLMNGGIYNEYCSLYSEALANIVNHFKNPTADNPEFIAAIKGFIDDPKKIPFPQDVEERSERPSRFTPKVSEQIESFIGQARAQKTEENPQATSFAVVTGSGLTIDEELKRSMDSFAQSLVELTKILEQITEQVQKDGPEAILARFGLGKDSVKVVSENGEQGVILTGFSGQDKEERPIVVKVARSDETQYQGELIGRGEHVEALEESAAREIAVNISEFTSQEPEVVVEGTATPTNAQMITDEAYSEEVLSNPDEPVVEGETSTKVDEEGINLTAEQLGISELTPEQIIAGIKQQPPQGMSQSESQMDLGPSQ